MLSFLQFVVVSLLPSYSFSPLYEANLFNVISLVSPPPPSPYHVPKLIGVCELGIRRFRSKISTDNKASIGLFKNRLKFKKVHVCKTHNSCFLLRMNALCMQLSESEVFREITLELDMDQVLVTEYEAEFKCFEWTKYARKTVSVKDTET